MIRCRCSCAFGNVGQLKLKVAAASFRIAAIDCAFTQPPWPILSWQVATLSHPPRLRLVPWPAALHHAARRHRAVPRPGR